VTRIATGPADFWRFFALREQARVNKERGDGPPYSQDPVLARYHFCNVFRECDAGTCYFQQFRARKTEFRGREQTTVGGRDWREVLLWQACLYRPVNRVSTFEAFRRDQSPGSPFCDVGEGREWWLKWVRARFGRERVFTGRHLNRGLDSYEQTVRYLEGRDRTGAPLRRTAAAVYSAPTLKAAVKALQTVPGVGAFFGWQIACDLVESGALADDPAWAQLGPGAKRGAKLVQAGVVTPLAPAAAPLAVAKWIVDSQQFHVDQLVGEVLRRASGPRGEEVSRFGVGPLGWYRYPVTLKDVEHALCEYVRYVNAREGKPSLEVKPWAR
jgi:alpha-glutamyl/putrescinyl thymine pyrophosphorylase clade 1